MAGLDLEETPISMEVELPAAEALLQSSALPNPLRKQRRHLLIWALIWALLAAVSGGLSAGLAPECVDPVPRRTTSGELCYHKWNLGNLTCDTYCCDFASVESSGDVCAVCDDLGSCKMRPCAAAASRLEYVFERFGQSIGFVAVWLGIVLVLLFSRSALRANGAERLMLLKSSAAFILVVLFMLMLFGAYLYTDCHNEYRGIADVLLAISFFCALSFFQFLVRASFINFAIPKLDGLLELVAEAGNSRDQRNLLVLEVRAETLRRFWEQQLEQDPGYVRNVQLSCPWLTYCSWVLLTMIPWLLIYAYSARVSLFLNVFWLRLCVFVARFYLLRLPMVQRWIHQRHVKKQLANVPPKLSVVLFHNNRAEGLDHPAPLNDLKLMSAAFFSETNVLLQHSPGNGERMFPSIITRSSILQNNNNWQLCFARSYRQSTQTLLQTARTQVEGTQFFPLEEQDVQRAREWLASHEVFHFEGDARGSVEQ